MSTSKDQVVDTFIQHRLDGFSDHFTGSRRIQVSPFNRSDPAFPHPFNNFYLTAKSCQGPVVQSSLESSRGSQHSHNSGMCMQYGGLYGGFHTYHGYAGESRTQGFNSGSRSCVAGNHYHLAVM